MMAQEYPWQATMRGACPLFDFVTNFGMTRLFAERPLRSGNGETLDEVFSTDLIEFIVALTDVNATTRAALGECCYDADVKSHKRKNVWNLEFLKEADAAFSVQKVLSNTSGRSMLAL
mmetsp:Transcript_124728/g.358236  ORF Transcript_124728/g.358236 Transcript_124728/m.358236 type:complete len:118 (+) Transcript_124728:41-394(+)